MAVTRNNYSDLAVRAAEMVLMELTRILGGYRDNIVVIGGMVPRYLAPGADITACNTIPAVHKRLLNYLHTLKQTSC